MIEENRDIKLLRRLQEETERQKRRVVQLMEIDCKIIGMKRVAINLGVTIPYLHNVFKGKDSISVDKAISLTKQIGEIKEVLKIETKPD